MNEIRVEKGPEPGDTEDTLPMLPEQSENIAFLKKNKSSTGEHYSLSCLWAEIKYVR